MLPTRSSIKVSGRIKPCTSDDMTLGSGSGSRPTSPMPSTKASSSTDESSKAKGKAGESRKREKRRTFDGASSLGAVGECRKAAELPTSGISDRPHSAVPTGVVDQRSRRRTTGSVKYSPNPSTK
ncbi:hypothetical protein EON64_02525 [archaeon]|nr:MAG: hypothetical protein EON64_02525 [archaeon]